jgi:hypothetical protein
MKSVYLAARFDRKDEMKALSLLIEELGVKCTSRWLDEAPSPSSVKARERFLVDTAQMDADDVYAADTLIRFSDDFRTRRTVPSGWLTASRMEETGMAHAWGKTIVIVGGKQSLFDRFANRVHVRGVKELLAYIRRERGR